MKLTVTQGFIDKDTNIFHRIGEVVEYPEARAKEIEYRGFGKCSDKPKLSKAESKSEKVEETIKEMETPKKTSRKRS